MLQLNGHPQRIILLLLLLLLTHDDVGAKACEEFDAVVKATDLREQRIIARRRRLPQSLSSSNGHQVSWTTPSRTL